MDYEMLELFYETQFGEVFEIQEVKERKKRSEYEDMKEIGLMLYHYKLNGNVIKELKEKKWKLKATKSNL